MEAKVRQAVVLGSVPVADGAMLEDYYQPGSPVYCADGGLKNAAPMGLTPDFLIGDWDSGGTPLEGVRSVSLPAEKDLTDLQAAMEAALQDGYRQLLLCGCMGGARLDHAASNFLILEWLADHGGEGIILDERNEVRLLDGDEVRLDNTTGPRYRYFSIIPLDRRISGVFLEGAKYPISDASLTRGDTLSMSNEPMGPETRVLVKEGRALLIRSERL